MPNFGVGVAIFAGEKVLLTQREDFEIWCLPGGALEDGESFAQTARSGSSTPLARCLQRSLRSEWFRRRHAMPTTP